MATDKFTLSCFSFPGGIAQKVTPTFEYTHGDNILLSSRRANIFLHTTLYASRNVRRRRIIALKRTPSRSLFPNTTPSYPTQKRCTSSLLFLQSFFASNRLFTCPHHTPCLRSRIETETENDACQHKSANVRQLPIEYLTGLAGFADLFPE